VWQTKLRELIVTTLIYGGMPITGLIRITLLGVNDWAPKRVIVWRQATGGWMYGVIKHNSVLARY